MKKEPKKVENKEGLKQEEVKQPFINPIDDDKITENPSTLPYAHTVGGVVIKPIDKGRVKGRAIAAMEEQTNAQMDQIKKQIELLAEQVQAIQKRKEVSEMIYGATISFEPLISHVYHLYQKKNDELLLSMIAPNEWGRSKPFERFIASVKLLSDHTWKILEDE